MTKESNNNIIEDDKEEEYTIDFIIEATINACFDAFDFKCR